jgi:hypothetical protein
LIKRVLSIEIVVLVEPELKVTTSVLSVLLLAGAVAPGVVPPQFAAVAQAPVEAVELQVPLAA